jgi:uncharacterized membrane protein
MAAAIVADMCVALLTRELRPKSARDAAMIANVFLNVARLEGGEATSITEHMTREDKIAAITAIGAEAKRQLGELT